MKLRCRIWLLIGWFKLTGVSVQRFLSIIFDVVSFFCHVSCHLFAWCCYKCLVWNFPVCFHSDFFLRECMKYWLLSCLYWNMIRKCMNFWIIRTSKWRDQASVRDLETKNIFVLCVEDRSSAVWFKIFTYWAYFLRSTSYFEFWQKETG